MIYGSKVLGEKKMDRGTGGMNWHLVHSPGNRMYRCTCMPAFRVGAGVHHPRLTRFNAWKITKPKNYFRSVKRCLRLA